MKKLLVLALAIPLASVASAAPKASTSATLVTRSPVAALAADGNRAALTIRRRGRWQILVWEPAAHRLQTIHTESDTDPGESVALAGTRVAWDEWYGGLTITTRVSSATLARHAPVSLGSEDGSDSTGWEVLAPSGDGKLLAFTVQYRCEESIEEPDCPPGRHYGDVTQATIWRAAPRGGCPTGSVSDFRRPGHCAKVASAHGRLTLLDVDAGRIAARTDDGIRLLSGAGRLLLDVPVRNVSGAALSGNRLGVRVPGSLEIYDTGSGELLDTIPAQSGERLEDLKGGILVTAMAKTVTLRRLSDGHTARLHAAGYAHARLEGPGLFVAGARRVTFTPMADVLRRLG
jgi:hypothetical protein